MQKKFRPKNIKAMPADSTLFADELINEDNFNR